ncbi:ankyrin-1-like [Lineus longissimus]|uniref:ankyrin-1-like n=1 Tax=Lineus longissimus TaxID=88925 RepID=UPI00315CABF5
MDIVRLLNACETGQLSEDLVNEVKSHTTDVNCSAAKYIRRPLHVAIEYGHKDILNFLIENGADLESSALDGSSPLILAARRGEARVMKKLLDRGANINVQNKYLERPLHLACRSSDVTTVRKILELGADVMSFDSVDTPLHIASRRGAVDICTVLLDAGADVDALNKHNLTSLHEACNRGNAQVVEILIKRRADIHHLGKGKTPFALACLNGNVNIIRMLLQRGCEVNVYSATELPPICVAYNEQNVPLMKLLREFGAEVPPERMTYLHIACLLGDLEEVDKLLAREDIPKHAKDGRGNTALHIAVRKNHLGVADLCLQNGIDVNFMDQERNTALHLATRQRNAALVDLLLQYNAKSNWKNFEGFTPLHIAASNGDIDLLKKYLNATESPAGTFDLKSALRMAARGGHVSCMELLIQNGAQLDPEEGRQFLLSAVEDGYLELVDVLMEKYLITADVKHFFSQRGLHQVCWRADLYHFQRIVDFGVDVDCCGSGGDSALHFCAVHGITHAASVLIQLGATVDLADVNGITPLMTACLHGHQAIVKLFLENKADALKKDNRGQQALHYASERGNLKIIRELLKQVPEIDINAKSKEGETALHRAAERGHLFCVLDLLSREAHVNATDSKSRTPFAAACANIFEMSGMRRFVRARVETLMNKRSTSGIEIMELLLLTGCDGRIKDINQETPFISLVRKRLGTNPATGARDFQYLFDDDLSTSIFHLLQDACYAQGDLESTLWLTLGNIELLIKKTLAFLIIAGCGSETIISDTLLTRIFIQKDFDSFRLLHRCCYRLTDDVIQATLTEVPLPVDTLNEFLDIFREVPTLKLLCRAAVRGHVRKLNKGCLSTAVQTFHIPQVLKNVLLFSTKASNYIFVAPDEVKFPYTPFGHLVD